MVALNRCADKTAAPSVSALKEQLVTAMREALETPEVEGMLLEMAQRAWSLDEMEQQLLRLRNRVWHRVAQSWMARDRGYRGARRRCQCGRTARYVRDDRKRYVTLVGEVEVRRAQYWCPACGACRPLDEEKDLPEGHCTRGVVRQAALMGAVLPFQRAAAVLEELTGVQMSASQLRRLTQRVGEAIGQEEAQQVEAALGGEGERGEPPAVLVVMLDGAHVNTREGGWKEAKMATVAGCEREEGHEGVGGLRPSQVDYGALVGPPEPVGRKAYALAQRLGGQGKECTLAIGDGAPWIWNQVSEHFPKAIQVLDLYHLAEHVHATAKELWGENAERAQDWAETVLTLLREEEIEAALEYVQRHGEGAERLVAYIRANRDRMPYRWLRERGYPIGSGLVESACKQIVQSRHRQAGMRWGQEHVQKMLDLACCIRGQRWEAFWARRPKVA